MSYTQYQGWLAHLKPAALNKEIEKLNRNKNARGISPQARAAWTKMYDMAILVQKASDAK